MRGGTGIRRLRSVALPVIGVVSLSMVGTGVLAGPAWARGKGSITCTGFSGTLVLKGETVGTLSGCSGGTGGSGVYSSGPNFSISTTRMAIRWANATSTTVTVSANASAGDKGCASGFRFKAKGKVTANTNRSTSVGGKVVMAFCEAPTATSLVYSMWMPSGGKDKL